MAGVNVHESHQERLKRNARHFVAMQMLLFTIEETKEFKKIFEVYRMSIRLSLQGRQ